MDLSRREYRIRGWKKGLYLLLGGITLAVGFLIAAIAALRSALAVGLVVALPFMVFGLYLLIWTLRSTVVIDSTRCAAPSWSGRPPSATSRASV
jgi:hypothetical protein